MPDFDDSGVSSSDDAHDTLAGGVAVKKFTGTVYVLSSALLGVDLRSFPKFEPLVCLGGEQPIIHNIHESCDTISLSRETRSCWIKELIFLYDSRQKRKPVLTDARFESRLDCIRKTITEIRCANVLQLDALALKHNTRTSSQSPVLLTFSLSYYSNVDTHKNMDTKARIEQG